MKKGSRAQLVLNSSDESRLDSWFKLSCKISKKIMLMFSNECSYNSHAQLLRKYCL